ncbi:MAG: suppressor of fused domain protein [Polyangiaceae bacterium]|nr:suppressor of fused domain protein [Myxococcales bacterium]MCB9588971.1 suppressor of fused domain protein [Polyangiaceae bacterium]
MTHDVSTDDLDADVILTHIERHLGVAARYCKKEYAPTGDCIFYMTFHGTPVPEASTLVTFGLSRHLLEQPKSPAIRQELMLSCLTSQLDDSLLTVLSTLTEEVLERHIAMARNDVVGSRGPIAHHASVQGFLVQSPWCWDIEFERAPHNVAFPMLLPITPVEERFIRTHGSKQFLEALTDQDIDYLDLRRESAQVCRGPHDD